MQTVNSFRRNQLPSKIQLCAITTIFDCYKDMSMNSITRNCVNQSHFQSLLKDVLSLPCISNMGSLFRRPPFRLRLVLILCSKLGRSWVRGSCNDKIRPPMKSVQKLYVRTNIFQLFLYQSSSKHITINQSYDVAISDWESLQL